MDTSVDPGQRERDRDAELARLRNEFPEILPDQRHPLSGVLLRDEIEHFAKNHRMIHPFDETHLKPAAYELTVGEEYSKDGKTRHLEPREELTVEPYNVVVIQTAEVLNIPRFMVARWNIKVGLAYRGLMWVGGPQVDPGWLGKLLCPIYNLSDKKVALRRGDELAVIDFVATSPYDTKKWDENARWKYKPTRVFFSDYRPDLLLSGVAKQLRASEQDVGERMASTDRRVDTAEGRVDALMGWGSAALAILVAALAIMSSWGLGKPPWAFAGIAGVSVALSIVAVLQSRAALRRSKPSKS